MAGSGQISPLQKGMTLLEALISLVILLSAVIGLAAAYQHRIFQSSAAKNQAIAAMVAQSVANEMMSTDPDDWSSAALTREYQYTFQGERVGIGDVPYFTADVSWGAFANWYEVQIGVTWTGWTDEREKVGDANLSSFAYSMNVSIAPNYGDTENP